MINPSSYSSSEYLPEDYSSSSLSFAHYFPNKGQAQDIFWGLKDDFWKQIIDGKYHEYGPMVFDCVHDIFHSHYPITYSRRLFGISRKLM